MTSPIPGPARDQARPHLPLLAHITADHAILQAVYAIHQPDPTGRHCIEDGQTWQCPTVRAFDPLATFRSWASWHGLPVSHATPQCADCGEWPRLMGGTAVMRHLPTCAHPAYLTAKATTWRLTAALYLGE